MTSSFNPRTVLRQTSNGLLAEMFSVLEIPIRLNWSELAKTDVDTIFAAYLALDDGYRESRQNAVDLQGEVSLKRTDLALFDLNAAQRTVTCNLIEVKCYSSVGNLAQFAQLKDGIAEQLDASERVLRLHFDPRLHSPDRVDRSFKIAELSKLLEFYVDRSIRFGLLNFAAADEARFLIRTLEDGYQLRFTRSALVFDFEKIGTEAAEIDNGVHYHRIGIDIIRSLVEESVLDGDDSDESSYADEDSKPDDNGPVPLAAIGEHEGSGSLVPKLTDAVFLVRDRPRSVSWDSLTSRSSVSLLDDGDDDLRPVVKYSEASASEAPAKDAPSTDGVVERSPMPVESQPEPPQIETIVSATADPLPEQLQSEYTVSPAGIAKLKEEKEREPSGVDAFQLSGGPEHDVLLGSNHRSPQYGLIGDYAGRKIALDLNQTHTISLFGVQGGGKSYTLGSIAEMATMRIEGINLLPSPLATVIFHYSPTQDYRPEFTSMRHANTEQWAIDALQARYGAHPRAIEDVLLLRDQRMAQTSEVCTRHHSLKATEL